MGSANGCLCCNCVQTSEIAVKERFGRFSGLATAGLVCVAWPCEEVAGRVSTRVQQLDVPCETKTKDNVFVSVVVSVQYQVIHDKVYDAHYRLTSPESQIQSYVFDVVRSKIPRLDLDESFEDKEQVALDIKQSLGPVMEQYGYRILQALVTDLTPDIKVRDAMNAINEAKRLKEAAQERAEADKILQVKSAEADAEAKYLSGVGVARQRRAIVEGLRDSILEFSGQVEGTTPKDVMDLLLLTQYFDMLKDVGAHQNSSTGALSLMCTLCSFSFSLAARLARR
mmetsp:Transcript_13860/g.41186  ORF Transcript_13860/g.41186 Transcript_13860/m.41186 type:complete len:283 (-) Transcript_13860:234-1082(-)